MTPRLSDAGLVTLATMQAIPGCTCEAKWLRPARARLRRLVPCLPRQPGCSNRLRTAAGLMRSVSPILGTTTSVRATTYGSWTLPRWNAAAPARPADAPAWQAGPDTATVPAAAASSGACACTLQGLPIAFALTGAMADGRETLLGLLAAGCGRGFERELSEHGVQLLRPARKGERERPGAALSKPPRQVIEPVNETVKGQPDLERHRGRTLGGVIARVMQRILALTAAIWHNDATGQTVLRSLVAYDHRPLGIDHLGNHGKSARILSAL
jgi:hypothetical protein